MNLLDRVTSFGIDRISHARSMWMRAVSGQNSNLPRYLEDGPVELYGLMDNLRPEERQRIALTISWIYADIKLLASEVSSAGIQIKRKDGDREEVIKDHPLLQLLNHPNSEMDLPFLLQYTTYWMMLRGKAYWYLAPEMGNPDKIKEIWPIQADRIFPIPGKDRFIEKYVYRLKHGQVMTIDPDYVIFFRFPNPFDLWDGLSPLIAASLPMETELGLAKWQRDTYVTGRGIPHSVISLDKTMNKPDFESAAQRIREDFEQERKVAITRAGDMDVKTVGISPRDLELIKSREFTRDEIDTIFLGVPIRDHASDVWLQAADKIVKEKVVWPMHVLLAGQISVRLVRPFYDEEDYAEFDDIRPQDRALNVQEANIYWRVHTVDEAREKLGLPKFEEFSVNSDFDVSVEVAFKEYGRLPVPLAIDPAFITLLYDVGRVDPAEMNLPGQSDQLTRFVDKVNQVSAARQVESGKPPKQPSLRQGDSPVHTTNQLARGNTNPKKNELRLWRKIALKSFASGQEREFVSDVLTQSEIKSIQHYLSQAKTEDDIKGIFSVLIDSLYDTPEQSYKTPDIIIPGQEIKLAVDLAGFADELANAIASNSPIIHVNVPKVDPPVIQITVPESQPVINVTTPAPNITVKPSEVTVMPKVTAEVVLPETVEETQIIRDESGLIEKTIKTTKVKKNK